MTFLQNLWRDLVDKRLWPLAVALLLAVVAVPFVISSPGATPTAPAAAPAVGPATAVAPATAQVAVAVDPGGKTVKRTGASRDPFKPLVFAKTPKTPAAATAAGTLATGNATADAGAGTKAAKGGGAGASSSPGTIGTGSTGAGQGTSPSTGTTAPKAPTTITKTRTKLFSYAITVAVKRAGRITTRRGLRAITYLPSPAYPLVTFLGVKADGKTATFLLSKGVGVLAGATGCQPSATTCDVIELHAGENVLLARAPKLGEPVKRFRLVLRSVGLKEVVAKKPVAAARSRMRATGGAPALPVDLAPARQVSSTRTTG